MHEVEISAAPGEQLACAQREGARLGKSRRAHDPELEKVCQGLEFLESRNPERIRLAVQIEAGHRNETHPVLQLRVWLSGVDRNLVAQLG
jgi:hypothetical protein